MSVLLMGGCGERGPEVTQYVNWLDRKAGR